MPANFATQRVCLRGFLRGKTNSVESEHVGHGKKSVGFVFQEARSRYGTLCVACSRTRFMADLNAFTGTGKNYGMVTDNVSTAQSGKADGTIGAFTGMSLSTENCNRIEINIIISA